MGRRPPPRRPSGHKLARGKKHQAKSSHEAPTKGRFRFKNFGEQIEGISFDRVQHFGSSRGKTPGSQLGTPTEGQSWFSLAVGEWRELNCTAPFARFCDAIQGLHGSLNQMFFYRKQILMLLVEHLEQDDAHLAAAPLSALTAVLVKDFGEEMIPFFDQIFAGLIRLVGMVEEVESLEVLLGSIFYFVKELVHEVPPEQVLALLIGSLREARVRPQVQDFIAEFAIYILRKSFKTNLIELIVENLRQRDLCTTVLSGSVIEPKHKDVSLERLLVVLKTFPPQSDARELFDGLFLALIDRFSPATTWMAVSRMLSAISNGSITPNESSTLDEPTDSNESSLISHTIVSITVIASMRKAGLLAHHRELFVVLCKILASGEGVSLLERPIQDAIVSLVRLCELDVLLGVRGSLRDALLNPRGIGLLCSVAPDKVELLIGVTTAAQALATHIACCPRTNYHALTLYNNLLLAVTGSPVLSAQVVAQLLPECLFEILSNEQCDNRIRYIALNILSLAPRVKRVEWIEGLAQSPGAMDGQWRVAFLKLGMRFIPASLMPNLIAEMEAFLDCPATLELLLSFPDYVPQFEKMAPTLMSSDPRRRLLALQLLSRDSQCTSSELFQECFALEQIPWTFNCDREKGLKLQTLANILHRTSPSLAMGREVELTVCYLVGLLLHGFHPLGRDLYATLLVAFEKHLGVTRMMFLQILDSLSRYEPLPSPLGKNMTATGVTVLESVDLVLTGDLRYLQKVPNPLEATAPLFSETCLASLLQFMASKPTTSDALISGLLPLIESVFGGSAPPYALSAWFVKSFKNGLGDLLTVIGGMRSIKSKEKSLLGISELLHRYLAHGDATLQCRALESILALNLYEGMNLVADKLRRLLEDGDIRDELVTLALEQGEMRQADSWHSLRALLMHILYGRLIAKKGTSAGRNSQSTRRKLIFNYLSTWDEPSVHEFVLFMAQMAGVTAEGVVGKVERIDGFLTLLQTVLTKVGKRITQATVDSVMQWLVQLDNGEECEELKPLKKLIVKRLLDIYSVAPKTVDMERWHQQSWLIIEGNVARFEGECVQECSALLDLLQLWLNDERYFALCLTIASPVWPRLAAGLAIPSARDVVIGPILDMFSTLLQKLAMDGPHSNEIQAILTPVVASLCDALSSRIRKILVAGKTNAPMLNKIVQLLMGLSSQNLISASSDERECEALASSLTQLLLVKKGINESIKACMLRLLAVIHVPSLQDKVYSVCCSLLGQLRERESRFALSDLFSQLAQQDSSLQLFAEVLAGLHAPSTTRIGEYDYERQGVAFTTLRKAAHSMTDAQWTPVLHAMFYFARDEEDSAARSMAFTILELFVKRVKSEGVDPRWMSLLLAQLYPAVKRGFKSKAEGVRVDFLNLLNTMVINFDSPPFSALKPLLAHGNEDANILLNLLHLQQHRRARALRRLAEFAKGPSGAHLGKATIEDIILPLLEHFAFSEPNSRDPTSPMLVHEAIMAMAALCGRLPVKAALSRAAKSTVLMQKGVPYGKALIKLIPAIYGAIARDALSQEQCQASLGTLSNLLLDKRGDLRLAISSAIAQLIPHIQDPMKRNSQVSKLVCDLAKALTHKLDEKREEARKNLSSILNALGTDYLLLIISELRTLMGSGPRHHILAFTLNYLLKKFGELPEGVLDECVPQFISIIVEDLFGKSAKDKTATEWAGRILEIKAQKSPETLTMIMATARPSLFMTILKPLKRAMDVTFESESVEAVCKAIENGLIKRLPTAQAPAEIYALLYVLLDRCSAVYTESSGPHSALHSARLQSISCRVMLHLLKFQQALPDDFIAKMTPLLLSNVLAGGSTPLMAGSIKCLLFLLPGASQTVETTTLMTLLERLFFLVLNSDAVRHGELLGAAFKLITALVRERADVQLNEAQLKVLLEYVRNNYENAETQSSSIAHTLIRAILRRRIMLPEVYQLLSTISRAMLRSYVPAIRQQCRGAYLMFLLDYPFAQGKLEEHFAYLTANLVYEADGGRESLVLFIGQLVEKLPRETLNEFGEMLLVALAARLVNETNGNIRETVKASISKMIQRLDSRYLGRVRVLIERWFLASQSVERIAWRLSALVVASASVPVNDLISLLLGRLSVSKDERASLDKTRTLLAMVSRAAAYQSLRGEILGKAKEHITRITCCPGESRDVELCNELVGEYFAQVEEQGDNDPTELALFARWSVTWMRHLCSLRAEQASVSEQIVKNLLFVARRLHAEPLSSGKIVDATSLVVKMERIYRTSLDGRSPLFISSMLKLFAALLFCLGQASQQPLSDELATPMVMAATRILENRQNMSEDIMLMTQQLSELLKLQLGERYEELRASVLRNLINRREYHRQETARLAVTDPKAFSKRRLQRLQHNKTAKRSRKC